MSIQSEITRIEKAKNDIITSLQNKGSDIETGSNIDVIPPFIDKLSMGGSNNYEDLTNKPQINGVTLDGNKTADELQLAQLSDIPTKLPNPQTLTFTGAVSSTYDGSNAVTVDIPSGSGSNNYEDLINKPELNGVTLEGNKTLDQVGVLAKNQGSSNSGKYLSVGSDGNVALVDAPEVESIPNGSIEEIKFSESLRKRKASFYNSVEEMKSDVSLKDGMTAVTLGYYKYNDSGGATYRIRAKLETDIYDSGSIHELNGGQLVAELIIEGYVTPEMFGAVGNNVNDDTEAIQKCLDYSRKRHKVAFLSGIYKTISSIIIEGDNISIHGSRSSIIYTGSNSAIIIKNCHSSYIHLGVIDASNGIGIEFQSKKVGSSYNFNQYINLYFINIKSLDKCIYFNVASDANSGWNNEIRIFDGRLEKGDYGIYADAKNINRINNVTIQNVGIEGVSCGIFLANQIYSWNFLNLRYHESFNTLIETQGLVRNVQFIGSGPFYYAKHCSLSDDTVLKVLSPLAENGGTVIDYSAYLIGDMVIFDSYRKFVNIMNVSDYTVDPKSPINFFLLGDNSKSLTLSKAYGNNGFFFFINEFYVNNASDKTDFIVKDSKGSAIISTLDPWSFYKFIYFSEIGWKVIKLNN